MTQSGSKTKMIHSRRAENASQYRVAIFVPSPHMSRVLNAVSVSHLIRQHDVWFIVSNIRPHLVNELSDSSRWCLTASHIVIKLINDQNSSAPLCFHPLWRLKHSYSVSSYHTDPLSSVVRCRPEQTMRLRLLKLLTSTMAILQRLIPTSR